MNYIKNIAIVMGLSGAVSGSLAGCQEAPPEARGLKIEVAPLQLDAITEATYTLTVKNGLGQTVWTQGPISSTQYGDGRGALTYIGTCDASSNPHTVELVMNSLSTAEDGVLSSPEDYVNPTIDAAGVVRPIILRNIVCVENADVLVQFDLTILRSAKQGFFDFAIDFEDIFCSAKLDCQDKLLHDGDGDRAATAVLGFACTGGDNDPTYLYLSELELSCTGGPGGPTVTSIPVSTVKLPGQQGPIGPGIFEWAVYQGQEFLEADFDKCFWNFAVGLDTAALAGQTCTLSAVGTASQSPFVKNPAGEYQIPTGGAYPVIKWDVQVLAADGTLCENNGLNEVGSHVVTDYVYPDTVLTELSPLETVMDCGNEATSCTVPDTTFGSIVTTSAPGGFTLSSPGNPIALATFPLPPGYTLADSCCAPACCTAD